MARFRAILGLLGGLILILSSGAHSFLGWKRLSAELAAVPVPPPLFLNVKVAWLFGGVAMFVLGIILVALFARRLQRVPVSGMPALVTGVAYVAFGAWGILASGNLFFLIFVVPGVLLSLAAPGGGGAATV